MQRMYAVDMTVAGNLGDVLARQHSFAGNVDLGLPHSGLRSKIPLELTTVTTVQELH